MIPKIIRLLPILAVLIQARSIAQVPVDNSRKIGEDIGENHWDVPKLDFVDAYITAAWNASYLLIPEATFTSVGSDYVTLYGTNVSQSRGSAISGSSNLTFSVSGSDKVEASSSPSFADVWFAGDLTGSVTAYYSYYYSVDGSGEIYLNYDVSWIGHIDGWLPPDGSFENSDDNYDSTYLSLDTTVNVSSLPTPSGS